MESYVTQCSPSQHCASALRKPVGQLPVLTNNGAGNNVTSNLFKDFQEYAVLSSGKLYKHFGVAVLLSAAFAFGQSTQVTIDSGKLQGAVENGVLAFKGIPYA